MKIELNLNDWVTVRLTPLGRRRTYERGLGYLERDGTLTVELWRLMHHFGPMMRHASFAVPFEGVTLSLEGETRAPAPLEDDDDDDHDDDNGVGPLT